ncbi:hypothetical protein IJZ97_05730 [bacterium]|nr:hypothetical protein [bacterium]
MIALKMSISDIITNMNIKTKIKMLAVSRAMTLKQLAKALEERTGEPCSYNSLIGKLHRESLSLKEASIIADILNYKLEFIDKL